MDQVGLGKYRQHRKNHGPIPISPAVPMEDVTEVNWRLKQLNLNGTAFSEKAIAP